MNGWSAPWTVACDALAFGADTTVALSCAALAMFLAALLMLGFGPLRAWTWPACARRPSTHGDRWDGGLASVWQLYLQREPRRGVRQYQR